MKLLVDADYIVYKCCASAEYEIDFGEDVIVVASKFSEAMAAVERELKKLDVVFPFAEEKVLYFSGPKNFRKIIDPAYKGHRNRKKPCGYKRVIYALHDKYKVRINPVLEADMLQGEQSISKKIHNDTKQNNISLSELNYTNYTQIPLIPDKQKIAQNPTNIVEEKISNKWIRGGISSRDLSKDAKNYVSY